MSQTIVENNYEPISETARAFHACTSRIIVCVGGLGSGKSHAVVKEVEQSAMQWSKLRIGVFRKTMPALRDSTMAEFEEFTDPAVGEWKRREDKFSYLTESFVRFRGLDDPTKQKSTEYGLIIMEEAEEFTFEDFNKLNQRLRQKGPWPLRIIIVLNPVDEDHWIYREFVKNARVYEENGGLTVLRWSTRDNIKNLPPGYIEQITAGKSADEINRDIEGHWGTLVKGEPVYAKILNADVHLRRVELFPGHRLIRGWDFGYNHPACVFRVVDEFNRMNIRFAMMGEKEDLEIFVPRVLATTSHLFPKAGLIQDYGDPRGHDKAQNGRGTCFEVLADHGIQAIGERGTREYVEDGIRQNKRDFSTLIDGIPKLTIDPTCTLIRTAYFGRYVRGEDGKPLKDGYYEHVADADRYIPHHNMTNDAVKHAINQNRAKRRNARFNRSRNTGYR